jgi:hypothetical protein
MKSPGRNASEIRARSDGTVDDGQVLRVPEEMSPVRAQEALGALQAGVFATRTGDVDEKLHVAPPSSAGVEQGC